MNATQDIGRFSIGKVVTFAASVAVGCGAAIAFASAAAVSHAAPTLRDVPAATEVVRLEPVVVTIPRAQFEAARRDAAAQDEALARAGQASKVTRG